MEPTDMHQLDEDLNEFLKPMWAKLMMNQKKGNYRKKPMSVLLELMRVEVEELAHELRARNPKRANIVYECADVANFAMMLAAAASRGWEFGWQEDGDPL